MFWEFLAVFDKYILVCEYIFVWLVLYKIRPQGAMFESVLYI